MKNKTIAIAMVIIAALFMGAGIYGGIITGNLGKIFMDTDPSANDYNGLTQTVVPMTDASRGDLYFITTTSGPGYPYAAKADADATATMGDIVIMVSDCDSMGPGLALTYGSISSTSWAFSSAGLFVYVGNTAGLLTTTVPESGYIQKVGVTQTMGSIKFKPSLQVDAVPAE